MLFGLSLLIVQAAQMSQVVRPDSIVADRACAACRIVLTPFMTLGEAGDTAGAFGDTQIIQRSSVGNTYLPKISYRDRLMIYTKAGAFLRSVRFDSLGEGNIGTIQIGSADSIFVFNNGRSQLVHVDLNKGPSVVSAYPGSVYSALRLENGNWLVNGVFRTPQTLGLPLHILNSRGVVQSFGSRTREHRPDRTFEGWRHIVRASSSDVLSLSYSDPTVERWSTKGEYRGSLTLGLPEFSRSRTGQSRWSETMPPFSVIEDLRTGPNGTLWLIVTTAATSWKNAMKKVGTSDGNVLLPNDWSTALSSWIVIVDERTGQTIFAARFKEYLRQFVSTTHVSVLRGGPNRQQTMSILAIDAVLLGAGR